MNAGSEKLLIFRCAELLGRCSFTDKISQKNWFNSDWKSEIIKCSWEGCNDRNGKVKAWPVKCWLGQHGQNKAGGEEKTR